MARNKTDTRLKTLLSALKERSKKNHSKFWALLIKELEKPGRIKREVNISKISRYGDENKFVVIPGKVLGSGKIDKKFTVIALNFTQQARNKIEEAGGKCLMIEGIIDNKDDTNKQIQVIG